MRLCSKLRLLKAKQIEKICLWVHASSVLPRQSERCCRENCLQSTQVRVQKRIYTGSMHLQFIVDPWKLKPISLLKQNQKSMSARPCSRASTATAGWGGLSYIHDLGFLDIPSECKAFTVAAARSFGTSPAAECISLAIWKPSGVCTTAVQQLAASLAKGKVNTQNKHVRALAANQARLHRQQSERCRCRAGMLIALMGLEHVQNTDRVVQLQRLCPPRYDTWNIEAGLASLRPRA